MRWMMAGVLAGGAAAMLLASSLEAQSVEGILRAAERLELTEAQIQQLDAIRQETVARRSAEMSRMAELRSQLEAGQIRRSDLMAAMEDRQEVSRTDAEQRRASVEAILTETQRASLEEMRRRTARQRPGPGAARGPAGRRGASVGAAPGRGPRFAPGPRTGPRQRARPGGRPGRQDVGFGPR